MVALLASASPGLMGCETGPSCEDLGGTRVQTGMIPIMQPPIKSGNTTIYMPPIMIPTYDCVIPK